jgi:hypothetical protein
MAADLKGVLPLRGDYPRHYCRHGDARAGLAAAQGSRCGEGPREGGGGGGGRKNRAVCASVQPPPHSAPIHTLGLLAVIWVAFSHERPNVDFRKTFRPGHFRALVSHFAFQTTVALSLRSVGRSRSGPP